MGYVVPVVVSKIYQVICKRTNNFEEAQTTFGLEEGRWLKGLEWVKFER